MNILEKEIEDVVWESTGEALASRGLYLNHGAMKFRQLNLGSYGIADIVTVKLHRKSEVHRAEGYTNTEWIIKIDVIELKKEEINIDTFLQAIKYCKGLERFLDKYIDGDFQYSLEFGIVLIGKKIETKSSFCFLPDFFPRLRIYTYKIDLEKGVRFESQEGYKQTSSFEILPNLAEYMSIDNIKTALKHKSSEFKSWVSK